MFVEVQLLKESPAILSLGTLWEENGHSYDWHLGRASFLIKNGRTSNVKPTTTFPWLSQACKQPITTPVLWVTRSRHELWSTTIISWIRFNRLASTIHGRINRSVVKFDRRLSGWRGNTTASNSSFRATSSKTYFKHISRKAQFNHSFAQRPKVRSLQTLESNERVMQNKSWRSGGQITKNAEIFGDLITADHKVPNCEQEARLHHTYAMVVQDLATQWSQSWPCKTETAQETMRSLRNFLHLEENPRSSHTDISLEFIEACERLNCSHERGTSSVLVQSGLQERWWAEAMECYSYLRDVQAFQADDQSLSERRFNSPFDGPIIFWDLK